MINLATRAGSTIAPASVGLRSFSPARRVPGVGLAGGGAVPATQITGGGAIPSLKKGGKVKKTGTYRLHKGERVVSAAKVLGKGKKSKPWKSKKGQSKIHKVMKEFKAGTLRSGSKHGPVVRSRAQGVAIALSEARKANKV